MSLTDFDYMRLALAEAKKGLGRTSPNPAVGAVVVRNGTVVGKGYHRRAGTPHAEVHALNASGAKAKGATIYVTLEPCNHTGRTPPCTQAILASGIRQVVIGMADPNPWVNGGGAEYLAAQGISVTSGVLEAECRAINRPFIKHTTTGLPWVILKAGMSLDGRIATVTGHSSWITGKQSRLHVHRLRDRSDAILVGVGTALADDPSLTARLPGRRGRDPVRVVLDTELRLPATAKMLTQQSASRTMIFCGPQPAAQKVAALETAGALVRPVALARDGGLDLKLVLRQLGSEGITSVLVEGGGTVHGALLRGGLVDEVQLFVAPIFIGADGVPVVGGQGVSVVDQAPRLTEVRTRRFGDDVLIEGLLAGGTAVG
ncbi:MAG TPA: bifunctional diaminohydroxyphosphoribosylaminopyrimidine deaminase/5-amino-6-(5-phosphoribosylamino)uracil reductase RibD [Desulfurivibrionaceae bacterium]|nr:bifunctional diaminohydroxyphosphoribosylaminopyrimidine deaminase/5-amino-6-(5-phosphoribosylamino)uracil reductase RibD [Desulfurivibrionaceae bacterium]